MRGLIFSIYNTNPALGKKHPCRICKARGTKHFLQNMSAESRRHLTNRRTRFRSSTNNERGTAADDELDVAAAQRVYPTTPPTDTTRTAATDKLNEETQIRPAGFVGLGFTMLFLGLHQCICTYVFVYF